MQRGDNIVDWGCLRRSTAELVDNTNHFLLYVNLLDTAASRTLPIPGATLCITADDMPPESFRLTMCAPHNNSPARPERVADGAGRQREGGKANILLAREASGAWRGWVAFLFEPGAR